MRREQAGTCLGFCIMWRHDHNGISHQITISDFCQGTMFCSHVALRADPAAIKADDFLHHCRHLPSLPSSCGEPSPHIAQTVFQLISDLKIMSEDWSQFHHHNRRQIKSHLTVRSISYVVIFCNKSTDVRTLLTPSLCFSSSKFGPPYRRVNRVMFYTLKNGGNLRTRTHNTSWVDSTCL